MTISTLAPDNSLTNIKFKNSYRTGEDDLVEEFYSQALEQASSYDRAVGYFRSSVFYLVGHSFLDFAVSGGRARFICSPSLTDEDMDAINSGYLNRSKVINAALDRDLDFLLTQSDLEETTKFLATLVKFEVLDLRVALRKEGDGIYHEKIGLFSDNHGNCVSFVGSANETLNAWHSKGNQESIEVFCSWSASDEKRVQNHRVHFLRLWNNELKGVKTIDFPRALKERLIKRAANNLDVFVKKSSVFPFSGKKERELFPHQIEAIAAWEACGKRGILEHATGSGKTVTALAIMRKHLATGNPAIVLVPSTLLLQQWHAEILKELPGTSVLLAGNSNNTWKNIRKLHAHTRPCLGMKSVVLSTMQTAATNGFVSKIWQGDHLLLVVDEVHQIGSPKNLNALSFKFGSSLGLSATPVRFGDPKGTARIFDLVGNIVAPVYTLANAIRDGRLVQYQYHPHLVSLDEDELNSWLDLTKKIGLELKKESQNSEGTHELSQKVKMLILQRSRIAKKARRKPQLCAHIISKNFIPGQSWLVYCEDIEQLNEVIELLKIDGLKPLKYYSGMEGDKAETLEWFKNSGGILVSIRCLDEGIDMPAISHALILASSQNPRQFIQRRGRVLRKSKNKTMATIHDLLVVPVSNESNKEPKSLIKAELKRAIEFAENAFNKGASAVLKNLAIKSGVYEELNNIQEYEIEDE